MTDPRMASVLLAMIDAQPGALVDAIDTMEEQPDDPAAFMGDLVEQLGEASVAEPQTETETPQEVADDE